MHGWFSGEGAAFHTNGSTLNFSQASIQLLGLGLVIDSCPFYCIKLSMQSKKNAKNWKTELHQKNDDANAAWSTTDVCM